MPPGRTLLAASPVSHLLGEFDDTEVGAGIKDNLLREGLFTSISENS